jgi:hypothetical protein
MWRPQPAHVGLPQSGHWTLWHMGSILPVRFRVHEVPVIGAAGQPPGSSGVAVETVVCSARIRTVCVCPG